MKQTLLTLALGLLVFACSHGELSYRGLASTPSYRTKGLNWTPSYPNKPKATKLPFEDIHCDWVDKAGKGATLVETLPAYKVADCADEFGKEKLICNGTTRCEVTQKTTSGTKDFTIFIENVMCGAKGSQCKAATECVKDGGVLESVKAEIPRGLTKRKQNYVPPQSKIHE